jgi:hypothetical protein
MTFVLESPKVNQRAGYRVPRSRLLPPYLARNPYFVALTDIIDGMFLDQIDRPTEALRLIRDPWVSNPSIETKVNAGQLIDQSEWTLQDREVLVRQVNMLGMRLQNAGVVTNQAYQNIMRFVGTHWFGKGTYSFIEFINFCLDLDLSVSPLWTKDYASFVVKADVGGNPTIFDGDPNGFYPTTHVQIEVNDFNFDPATVVSLFNDVANYNLVLYALVMKYTKKIGVNGTGIANIVVLGLVEERIMYIGTRPNTTE